MNTSDYGPIGLLVIQSTSLCNLDCSYCYLPDRQKRNIFNLQQQLPLLLERVYESPFLGLNGPDAFVAAVRGPALALEEKPDLTRW